MRKQWIFRLIPDARERIKARADAEGVSMSDIVERWALSL